MHFILDLDDTLSHSTRDMQGDQTRLSHLTLAEGAEEFIQRFGKNCVLISAAANFEYQKRKIEHLKLDGAFKEIILVPTPEDKELAIKKALKDLGVQAGEVVVVGDRIEHEIRVANALGCITVRMMLPEGKYTSITPQHEREKPTYTVQNFLELMKLPIF